MSGTEEVLNIFCWVNRWLTQLAEDLWVLPLLSNKDYLHQQFLSLKISEVRPSFRSQLWHLLAEWPWVSYLTPLCLSFYICKMGMRVSLQVGECMSIGFQAWQPACKMAPMISTFWNVCPWVAPFHSVSGLVCVSSRIWLKWCNVTSEARSEKTCGFCIALSGIIHSGGSQLPHLKEPQATLWEVHIVTNWIQPTAMWGAPLEDYSLGNIFTATSWEKPSQKHPAKLLPDSSLSETMS